MPLIRIEFDNTIVQDSDARSLSRAVRDIVSEETSIADVFVYTNSAQIKVQVAPVEIFVEMTASKISNIDELMASIKARLIDWKKQSQFSHLINLTIIPMDWKVEIGI